VFTLKLLLSMEVLEEAGLELSVVEDVSLVGEGGGLLSLGAGDFILFVVDELDGKFLLLLFGGVLFVGALDLLESYLIRILFFEIFHDLIFALQIFYEDLVTLFVFLADPELLQFVVNQLFAMKFEYLIGVR
jgi:hypothetical protein